MAFAVTQSFAPLTAAAGAAVPFWLNAGVALAVVAFCVLGPVPETKGLTLEEIQRLFSDEEEDDRQQLLEEEDEDNADVVAA